MPVLFEVCFLRTVVDTSVPVQLFHCQFTAAFGQLVSPPDSISSNVQEITAWFYSSYQTVLDCVAPLKTKQPKIKSEPWFNDEVVHSDRNAIELNKGGRKTITERLLA